MTFTWTDDLATGNALIDSEHKELIRMISELMDACSKGKGRDQIMKSVSFLEQYTLKHFADEENLQRKSNYPDMQNHLRYHAEFRAAMQDIAHRLRTSGPSVQLLGEINMKVAVWFTGHIRTQDTRVAAHLRQQGMG